MEERRNYFAYLVFAIGVIAFLVLGLGQARWGTGIIILLAGIVLGIIFLRRAKR